jgi:light-regulated signal transduction histidine kinase (bacteriophytochrome)
MEIEYRVAWPDKSVHWILTKGHIYFDHEGKPERMIGVSMDSTARKMHSENLETQVNLRTRELTTANKELMKINEQLEQFVFISSHDLQEPLRKIQVFADQLSNPEAFVDAYTKKYADKIKRSASRMSLLLKDLLNFSLLIKDRDAIMEQVDLNSIVQKVLEDLEDNIERTEAVINVSPLLAVYADPIQMNHLFHNLLTNAIKFGKDNLVVNISAHAASEREILLHDGLKRGVRYAVIRVNDNGVGFNQKFAEKIFTLFQRLHDKKDAEGTGIGLAICKKIMDNHDGVIVAEGELDKGATFTVFLPLERIIPQKEVVETVLA